LEQRLELCPNIFKHSRWGCARKARAAVLPRGTAQLIGLHDPPYLMTFRYRDMKAPLAIVPCYGARDTSASELIERVRGKNERWPTDGLLVADRLQQVEPNDVA